MIREDSFGLKQKDLENILGTLTSNPKIKEIILFGSRAKGNWSPGSDIDISIKGNELNLDDILKATLSIEELSIPYKIDLVIYNRINEPELKKHIDRIGISLFKRTN